MTSVRRADEGLGTRLVAAVRAGEVEAVRRLLESGTDPDTRTADGLPVLCLTVAGHDPAVAEALVEAGADPDRPLPDGTTPLWRAVDGGSPAVVAAVLGKEPRLRLPAPARERLVALARRRYEEGVAAELRRRTGAAGPAVTERVMDDAYDWVEQVTLGGLTLRSGHGAILTSLEWAFRILTPVDELVDRAVRAPDEDHVDWSAVCWILAERPSDETRSAVVSHRHHPDPVHRRFVADYLQRKSFVVTGSPRHAEQDAELLTAWAAEETYGALLAKVLEALTEYGHPGRAAVPRGA
ncbi:ankyrin repeat domain-containing protein [Streptomyces sp. NPDC005865]|uniref:ankyrin repeat domain-containing protein n=1 Tax=Streptomyces sp. NPDC005865 TaxID=3155453 RepID=UPI0033CC6EC0